MDVLALADGKAGHQSLARHLQLLLLWLEHVGCVSQLHARQRARRRRRTSKKKRVRRRCVFSSFFSFFLLLLLLLLLDCWNRMLDAEGVLEQGGRQLEHGHKALDDVLGLFGHEDVAGMGDRLARLRGRVYGDIDKEFLVLRVHP